MIACLIAVLAGAMAQAEAEPPKDRAVWRIEVRGHDKPVYGFVDEEEEWKKPVMRVELDEPWNPRTTRVRIETSKLGHLEKLTGSRLSQSRRERGLAAGYTEFNGQWWPSEEVKWAQEARRLRGFPLEPKPDDGEGEGEGDGEGDGEGEGEGENEGEGAPRGILAQWGPHLAVILVALVLIGVITRTMLLS